MKIRPIAHGVQILGASEGRSKGLHASDVYNDLYAALEPDRYGDDGPPNETKMAMGVAWEQYLERRLIASGIPAQRPGEFVVDVEGTALAFSPDLVIADDANEPFGGEIKLTWMSEKDALDDPKFAKWITQVKTYGHHLGVPHWRFYVLFVNGDYKKNRQPTLRAYDVELSAREMREEWEMLVNHAKHRRLL